MTLSWHRETNPTWDDAKARIVGGAPAGTFDTRYGELEPGAAVPGEWWRAEREGQTVGYGWIDVVWGDAEVLLATAEDARGAGVGSFVLEQLDKEARARGLNYMTNIVRSTHPQAEAVTAWLTKRGFKGSEDGRLLRRVSS